MIDADNLSEGLLTLHISNWQGGRGRVSSSKFSNGWVNIPERKIFRNILSMSWKNKPFLVFFLSSPRHILYFYYAEERFLLMLKASNKSCKASLFDGRIDLVSQAWTKCFGIHCGINQDLPSDELSICSAELFCCLNVGWFCGKEEIDQKSDNPDDIPNCACFNGCHWITEEVFAYAVIANPFVKH